MVTKHLLSTRILCHQLQDVIKSADLLPRLDYIALEMRPKEIDMILEELRGVIDPPDPPHDKVEQTCRERGIIYETKPTSSCAKGGRKCRYYRHVRVSRAHNQNRRSLRERLTFILRRSQEGQLSLALFMYAVNDLSSEELDIYELEWDKLLWEEEYGWSQVEYEQMEGRRGGWTQK